MQNHSLNFNCQMDSPSRSWYQRPASQRRSHPYNPSLFGVPIYPVDQTRDTRHSAYVDRQPPVEQKSGRKVVQIPVQFLGSDFSDSDRRSESALRIQKVLRGFLVRKSVRKIKEIKSQVDEIEIRLLRNEVVEMIRRNERERLRMSESLMNLLLKLDGIRGIDSGIRICRKGVTRKAIALQDKIDAIYDRDSEGDGDDEVEIGNQELEDGAPVEIELSPENGAAAELDGSRVENSENSDHFEETLDDSGEELKGLNSVVLECEKMGVERDSVHTEELDAVVAYEVNPREETLVETSKNIDFDEHNVDSVKEMLVQNIGKDKINGEREEDDAVGNFESLEKSDLGEMLGDLKEIHEVGKDVEVENVTMEVERNQLDTELVDVPVTSVVEVTRKLCPVKGTCENLDFDEGNVETLKEMLAYSDDHGEILSDLSEESKEGNPLKVQGETMEVEKDHLDAESIDVSVAAVKASQETQAMKETPENLDLDVDRAGTMKEMVVGRSGEDTAVVEDLDKRKCELLQQMMEENKKMMLMMTQLHERNEMQLQMLDHLTNRVEFLEKAYLCDKLRYRRKNMEKNKCALTCI